MPILFLQILNVCCSVVYLFFELEFYMLILLKLFANILVCLLITDNYKISKLFNLIMISLLLMFSYYGFYAFISKLISATIFELFNKNISYLATIVIFFAIIIYIFAVFKTTKRLVQNKIIKNFIKEVSFFAFGKHIKFNGLIDSGNALYDYKTKLPVVIVSVYSLKEYLQKNIYENITNRKFDDLFFDHYLKVSVVSGEISEIPIIKIPEIIVSDEKNSERFKCVIGLVNHKFENENSYSCLLHREFV